jgi:hypothetical protein
MFDVRCSPENHWCLYRFASSRTARPTADALIEHRVRPHLNADQRFRTVPRPFVPSVSLVAPKAANPEPAAAEATATR